MLPWAVRSTVWSLSHFIPTPSLSMVSSALAGEKAKGQKAHLPEASVLTGFPGGSVVKNLPANVGDASSISGLGRSPGEGNGYSLQYSCLENPLGRGAWRATVHGVARVRHDLATQQQQQKHSLLLELEDIEKGGNYRKMQFDVFPFNLDALVCHTL